jgi:hypothetical protein
MKQLRTKFSRNKRDDSPEKEQISDVLNIKDLPLDIKQEKILDFLTKKDWDNIALVNHGFNSDIQEKRAPGIYLRIPESLIENNNISKTRKNIVRFITSKKSDNVQELYLERVIKYLNKKKKKKIIPKIHKI